MDTYAHNCTSELNALSLRATPARLAVLEFLERTNKPVDVAMLVKYLERKGIATDQATVFRIVNVFTGKGLLKQLQLNEGKFRYELSSKPEHHHLICKHCGRIEDISSCGIEDMEKRIEKKTGFHVYAHALEFFGICKECQV